MEESHSLLLVASASVPKVEVVLSRTWKNVQSVFCTQSGYCRRGGGRTGVRDGAQGHYYISGGMLIEVYLPGDGKYAIALHCSSGSFMLGWQKRTVFTY